MVILSGATELERAWQSSIFARFPPDAAAALREGAVERVLEPGTVAYREHPAPHPILAVVIAGLARIYVASPEGREVTIRYPRAGDDIGLTSVMAGGSPGRMAAVTPLRLLYLDPELLRDLVRCDAVVASVVAEALAKSLFEVQDMLVDNVFGSVRTRVARHLLDLAAADEGGQLRVDVGQQGIADAVGSVREVVSRILGALREQGVIKRDAGSIILLDVEGICEIAHREMVRWENGEPDGRANGSDFSHGAPRVPS